MPIMRANYSLINIVAMDTKKEAKKYLNKYFKAQYINEDDAEYKALVRLLNKALLKQDVSAQDCSMCKSNNIRPIVGKSTFVCNSCYHVFSR